MISPSPDRLELRGIRLLATCGILLEERDAPQPFELDLDVVLDLATAVRSDELEDTVDYAWLGQVATEAATRGRYNLMEGLAGAVAEAVLADQRIDSVTVSLRKLRPPVPYQLETAGVRVTRSRSSL